MGPRPQKTARHARSLFALLAALSAAVLTQAALAAHRAKTSVHASAPVPVLAPPKLVPLKLPPVAPPIGTAVLPGMALL